MLKNILIENDNGDAITVDYRRPPPGQRDKESPLIIMTYGFQKTNDDVDILFSEIAEEIENAGISSICYDYGRHIKTDVPEGCFSMKSAISDMNNIFKWSEEYGFEKIAIITEGLGAALTISNMPENPVFCVFMWPVFDLANFVGNQRKLIAAKSPTAKHFCKNEEALLELEKLDISEGMNKINVPVSILHGANDQIVPISHLDIARKNLMSPRIDITVFDEGEHGLNQQNYRKACIQHIKGCIKAYGHNKPYLKS